MENSYRDEFGQSFDIVEQSEERVTYITKFGKCFAILEKSEEMKIDRYRQALQASFDVFNGNFHELIQELAHLKDSRNSLFIYNTNDSVKGLLDKASRLFHNFLASVLSLIDHTRVIVNKLYSGQTFKDEYQHKLSQDVISHPIHSFIKDLRNYAQHYTLPLLALEITLLEDFKDFKLTITINVEILKKWDRWTKNSASYLETLGDSCCMEDIANEYFVLIQNFYEWLTQRQLSIHQSDFVRLQQMYEDLDA